VRLLVGICYYDHGLISRLSRIGIIDLSRLSFRGPKFKSREGLFLGPVCSLEKNFIFWARNKWLDVKCKHETIKLDLRIIVVCQSP
jgi:hypothetical protein